MGRLIMLTAVLKALSQFHDIHRHRLGL